MADPAARPKPAISRGEWGLLLLLAAVQFTNILDFVIMMPLAPWAKEQFAHHLRAVRPRGRRLRARVVRQQPAGRQVPRPVRPQGRPPRHVRSGSRSARSVRPGPVTYEPLVAARAWPGSFGGRGRVGRACHRRRRVRRLPPRDGHGRGHVLLRGRVRRRRPIGLCSPRRSAPSGPRSSPWPSLSWPGLGWQLLRPAVPPRSPGPPGPPPASARGAGDGAEPPAGLPFTIVARVRVVHGRPVPGRLAWWRTPGSKEDIPEVRIPWPALVRRSSARTWSAGWPTGTGKLRVFRVMGLAAIGMRWCMTNLPPSRCGWPIVVSTAFMVATSADGPGPGDARPAARPGGARRVPEPERGGPVGGDGPGEPSRRGADPPAADGRLPGYPVVGLLAAASALASLVLGGF